jgi:hypothetical protein
LSRYFRENTEIIVTVIRFLRLGKQYARSLSFKSGKASDQFSPGSPEYFSDFSALSLSFQKFTSADLWLIARSSDSCRHSLLP